MSSNYIQKIKEIYPDGDITDEKIVFLHAGWGSKEAQDLRYGSINTIYRAYSSQYIKAHSTTPHTLEVGCGFGNFYAKYAIKDGYFGIDINPQAIHYCKAKYPPEKFCEMDITSKAFMELLDKFRPDYIIASGVFDHVHIWKKIKEQKLLHRILKKTNCAIIATMLHDVTPKKYRNLLHKQEIVYTSPLHIIKLFSKEIYSQKLFFQIKNDYMDNDYTIALVKSFQLSLRNEYRRWKGMDSGTDKKHK